MVWAEVRKAYPDQWLIIEAIDAHTEDDRRWLDRVAVVETCPDGTAAMQAYERLHHEYPAREFYFVHTGREDLDIRERRWIGIRSAALLRLRFTPPSAPLRVWLRMRDARHIANTYLKSTQAPVGFKPVLGAWMELN